VIAVAAPIGGGKSALVRGLAAALGDAASLHFDDYELATRQSPEQLARWMAAGADFNSLHAPGFADALHALGRGETIADRASGKPIRPTRFLVLEMPLGRAYAETADLIDILVWVDTPLDLALARNLRSLTAAALAEDTDPAGFLRWLDAYLGQYMDQVRQILELQKTRVATGADLILDGTRPQEELIADAARMVGQFSRRRRVPDASA
jgi:uridine kinase